MPTSQNYRTRRLVAGDITELNQVCSTSSSSWAYLRDNIQAFYTEKQCECGNQMTIKVRHDTNQPFQWVCRTGPNHHVRISITKGSLFYRLKSPVATIIMVMHEFLAGVQVSATLRHLQIHPTTLAQIRMDMIMVMNHELIARPDILGLDPEVDHIQIDESKFGKRKYERGHRVEGVWVFGMIECIKTGESVMYQNQETGDLEERFILRTGKRFVCTVPNRTAATLIPIIFKYVHPGATIRSDGWRAYNGLHGPSSPYNHEVCNHSVGFLTQDELMTNGTSGRIHTNAIEGLWARVKHCVPFRERTAELCPARLVEYLWRYRHQSNLQEGFNQALRSVSFDPSESRTSDHQHGRVQLETQQGDWTVVSQVERTSDGLYQPPAFVRLDNEEFTEDSDADDGAPDDRDNWNTMVYQDFISSLLPENEGAPMVIISDQSDENEELSGADSNSDSDYDPSIEIHRHYPRRRN